MTTFLVAHGAWSAGWAWKKMRPLLEGDGDRLFTPSYTGLGERAHLANPAVDLETHVQDVLGVLESEDLRDVVLIGHSYGGMVATGVADRARDRIRHLAYLDAFVPGDGQSLFDLLPPAQRGRMREEAEARGDGWRIPPNPIPPDTSPADEAWIAPRRRPQPIACFEMPLRLRNGELTLPRSYIYCARIAPGDVFRQFRERAQRAGWSGYTMDASHSPHVTAPEALARVLREIASRAS
jgi:pimeloyl-ACP methyl ester carboxylesterase